MEAEALDYDIVTGSAYNSDGGLYFREPLTAINAVIEARKDETAAPGMVRAIAEAPLPMPVVREQYRAITQARDPHAMIAAQAGVSGSGSYGIQGMRARPTYSFNPNRRLR